MKKVFALLLAVVLLTTITATCFAAHTHSWKTVGWTYSGSSNYYHTVSGCHNCTYAHTHTIGAYVTKHEECRYCTATRNTTEYNASYEYCPYSH